MAQNFPRTDPGTAGWSAYSFWAVTFTNRQGHAATATIFAASAADAILALNTAIDLNVYGPLTNVVATPTIGPGVA